MHVGRNMSWSKQSTRHKQIYYEVFHCNKNAYVDVLHSPLVDAYECLGLSDEFSLELGRTHSLGNLNVNQSPACVIKMRDNGHIREKHSDLTGGDCQRMLNEKYELAVPVDGITTTFAALRPMAEAGCNGDVMPSIRNSAKKCLIVFHQLFTLFSASAKLRNTIHTWGDHSEEHQRLVEEFFTILHRDVNSKLVKNMKAGLTYLTWPAHYLGEHLSADMAAWADFTGGLPFGRSSNQVTEHMNKIIKRFLRRHTNGRVSGTNIRDSKFRQVLVRVGALRLRRSEMESKAIRISYPCKFCVRRGIVLDEDSMHSRRTSSKCNAMDRISRRMSRIGRAIGESESDSQSGSESDEGSESERGSDSE